MEVFFKKRRQQEQELLITLGYSPEAATIT